MRGPAVQPIIIAAGVWIFVDEARAGQEALIAAEEMHD